MSDYEARFSGVARLFGASGMERLRSAHICVIGLRGVGSWAVEALARSGLGKLTLVDLDEICVSNVNRQLHALDGAIGRPKADALAQRVRAINPECVVQAMQTFFTSANAGEILRPGFDHVLDCIDSPSKKCFLIRGCRERDIPVITAGAAGGRRDPTLVRVCDLSLSSHDRLLQEVRTKLRSRDGFPRGDMPFGVDCVFSPEPPVFPASDGSVCDRPEAGANLRLDCESGHGTACFVTGTFGFVAAGHIVRSIVAKA